MNNLALKKEWFHNWFDSPFYHILYQNRDEQEAAKFLKLLTDNLTKNYQVSQASNVLDVACGRGRHAVFLNELGYSVTGIDLSQNSISYAKKYENQRLHFECHDMRKVYRHASFELVLNLFTSFGYFEEEGDDLKVIQSMAQNLKPNGVLVLDYFNPDYVKSNISKAEIKTISGIDFELSRAIELDFVVKDIKFDFEGISYKFQESVRLISIDKFLEYFNKSGLTVLSTLGNYSLDAFNKRSSERMIFIARKK